MLSLTQVRHGKGVRMSNRPARTILAGLAAALAWPALATAQPSLVVVPFSNAAGHVAATDIDLTFPERLAPAQRVDVFVPRGYRVAVGQASGTRIGTVELYAGGGTRPTRFTGTVVVDDPVRHLANPCDPGTHAGVWLLTLTRPQPVTIAVFVDAAAGTQAALGAYRMTVCFPADVVPGTAGSRLRTLSINLPRILTNPRQSTTYRWRALVTPYAVGNAAPNPAAQVEVRALVLLSQRLTMRARYDRRTRTVVLTGRLTVGGRGERGVVVDILATDRPRGTPRRFASTKTRAGGTFAVRKRIARTIYLFAFVDVYVGRCTGPRAAAPGGCVRETTSPAFGSFVRVAVRR